MQNQRLGNLLSFFPPSAVPFRVRLPNCNPQDQASYGECDQKRPQLPRCRSTYRCPFDDEAPTGTRTITATWLRSGLLAGSRY